MIIYTDDVPNVLRTACAAWHAFYHLDAWDIGVRMEDAFLEDGEDTELGAVTVTEEPVRVASIVFRRGRTDSEYETYAAHEFLHIAHSGVDHLVSGRLIQMLPEHDQSMAHALYRDALERFVVDMTHLIARRLREPAANA